MSTEDYDQLEKLFCGTWKRVKSENEEEFVTAAGMSDEVRKFVGHERTIIRTRVGNSIHEKLKAGDKEFEIIKKLNEEIEWKNKEENPLFHFKTTSTFIDGVWRQENTPLNENFGKKHVVSCYIKGDELIADFSLPDVPSVTGRRVFQRC